MTQNADAINAMEVDLRASEKKLADAKAKTAKDSKKQAEIAAAELEANRQTAPVPAKLNDADKQAFEAQRLANREAEKQAKAEVAKKKSAYQLAIDLAALDAEYYQGPLVGVQCPRCKGYATVVTPEGHVCNTCGNVWGA